MNEKEMNLAILAELRRIANEVFAQMTIDKEGTYTAAELYKGKNSLGERLTIIYNDVENDVFTAEIGNFKMKVRASYLFWEVLWKFERLCNVKQADKMRFTYGKQEGENIAEKAMYLNKDGKTITRKKNLIRLSNHVAIEPDKKTKSYNMYYFVSGMWFLLCQRYEESQYKAIKERIEKNENYLFNLLQRWDFNTENRLNPIYKALFEALKSEIVNNTPDKRKSENEAENSVICDNVGTDAPEKSESVQETNEDYPPETYNERESNKVNRHIEPPVQNTTKNGVIYDTSNSKSGICNRATYRPIYDHSKNSFTKSDFRLRLRQKVFPTELFNARRKISRFKPRYLFYLTNYQLLKENALERGRSVNTSVYRTLIRSETEISSG